MHKNISVVFDIILLTCCDTRERNFWKLIGNDAMHIQWYGTNRVPVCSTLGKYPASMPHQVIWEALP